MKNNDISEQDEIELDELEGQYEQDEINRYWHDMETEYLQCRTEELKREIRNLKRRKTK